MPPLRAPATGQTRKAREPSLEPGDARARAPTMSPSREGRGGVSMSPSHPTPPFLPGTDRMTRPARMMLGALALLALAALATMVTWRPSSDEGPAAGGGSDVPPQRVVSLMPAATEILFAIGAGDRLVGRTHWGVYPPAAAAVPDVGDGVRPSLESVLARGPDLVILFEGPDTRAAAERLEALGVPTLSLRHNSIPDLYRNIRRIGEAVGCPRSAERVAGRIEQELDGIAVAVGKGPRPTVYFDVWPDPPMTIGRGSYLDSLISLAGGRNAFGDLEQPSPVVALEAIVHRDPDLVIHAVSGLAADSREAVADRPGWLAIPAVAAGRVATVDADLLGRLGPRVANAVRELAAVILPGAALPASPGPVAEACR